MLRSTLQLLAPKKASALKHAFAPVNSVKLVGVVHDIQTGFVLDNPVTQFSVTTALANLSDGMPEQNRLPKKSPATLNDTVKAKETFTVRCIGDEYTNTVKINDGCLVEIKGQLVLNALVDSSSGKPQLFPYISVNKPAKGQVKVLQGKKA